MRKRKLRPDNATAPPEPSNPETGIVLPSGSGTAEQPKPPACEPGTAPCLESAPEEEEQEGEVTQSELTCSLCHDLFVDPVRTPCGHAYCRLDVERFFQNRILSFRNGTQQSLSQPHQKPCPLCRRSFALSEVIEDRSLDDLAKVAYPRLYAQRRVENEAALARLRERQVHHVALIVGNTHREVPSPSAAGRGMQTRSRRAASTGTSNGHEWTFYIRMELTGPSAPQVGNAEVEGAGGGSESRQINDPPAGLQSVEDQFVDRIVVHLHPTFSQPTVFVDAPPFQVRRVGWGIFDVRAVIYFKPEWDIAPLPISWTLDFDAPDRHTTVLLDIERLQADESSGVRRPTSTLMRGASMFLENVMGAEWHSILLGLLGGDLEGEESEDEDWYPDNIRENTVSSSLLQCVLQDFVFCLL